MGRRLFGHPATLQAPLLLQLQHLHHLHNHLGQVDRRVCQDLHQDLHLDLHLDRLGPLQDHRLDRLLEPLDRNSLLGHLLDNLIHLRLDHLSDLLAPYQCRLPKHQ